MSKCSRAVTIPSVSKALNKNERGAKISWQLMGEKEKALKIIELIEVQVDHPNILKEYA